MAEFFVSHGDDEGVHLFNLASVREGDAVQTVRLVRIRGLVHDHRFNAVFPQLVHDVDDLGISGIRAVLLEGKAQNRNPGGFDRDVGLDQVLHHVLRHIFSHVIVDPAAGENDLAVIAHHFRAVGQVIGIHADTVSAHQTGEEFQEIPLGSRSLQHGFGVDAHFIENNGKFVHESDIDIPLAVLDDLGGLRNLNGLRTVYARFHHQLVNLCDGVQGFLIHTGNDLHDGFQTVHLVAGVDALRRIPHLEVHAAFQAGLFFHNRHADLLRHSGIHGGLKDHDAALCQVPSHGTAGALHRSQVRRMVGVHRRRDSHDVKFRFLQPGLIRREIHVGGFDHIIAHLSGRIHTGFVQFNLFFIQIIADDINLSAESHRDGHAHIAQSHQGKLLFSVYKLLI